MPTSVRGGVTEVRVVVVWPPPSNLPINHIRMKHTETVLYVFVLEFRLKANDIKNTPDSRGMDRTVATQDHDTSRQHSSSKPIMQR